MAIQKICFAALLCCLPATLGFGDSVPPWFIPLRDAVYGQLLRADEVLPLYRETLARAEETRPEAERALLRSRCEYMLGRVYLFDERKPEALACFEAGMAAAQASLDAAPSAPAWAMLAENFSQSCTIRPAFYVMSHGLDVERYAKKALDLDPGSVVARYLLACRWVYAPAPFNNLKRGIHMLEDILNGPSPLDRDDRFNVKLSLGYAYLEQKKSPEAARWLQEAQTEYPTNKYVQELLGKT